MRSNWDTVNGGLDQLFFSPFVKDESPQDRAECIETFLKSNGWTWDEVLAKIAKE
jgi:hypothetical protein